MSGCGGLLLVLGLLAPRDTLTHPLDPLTAAELTAARQVLEERGKLGRAVRFASLTLHEPDKAAVREQLRSGRFRRVAEAILYDWQGSAGFRAQVDLERRALVAWDSLPSREPPTRALIRRRLEEVVRADRRWQAALRRRGIADSSSVLILPVLGESEALPWRNGERVVRAFPFNSERIEGSQPTGRLGLVVNLSSGAILSLSDSGFAESPALPAPARTPARDSVRREAPGALGLHGSSLSWKNWQLHFGVHPRRGLELWDVAWVEGGQPRTILYRASVSEAMAVYGAKGFVEWYPRDAGNAGLGDYQRNSAVEQADAPPGARYVDAVFADDRGRPVVLPRAAAVYERDAGVLWRHAGRAERAHQLVLTSHTTIDNYDFVFSWIFGEDGAIEIAVELTGAMLLQAETKELLDSDPDEAFSHRVAPGIRAPNHQHFFSYRLDFDLDGAAPNRVLELEHERIPQGRANLSGLWYAMTARPLEREAEARRNLHTAAGRRWRVINPGSRNSLGEPVGYTVIPGEAAVPYATARSSARRAAGFVGAQLWVTAYRSDEMYAAGEFLNFGWRDQGLPSWTAADRPLLDRDVVLWYTLGSTHLPRPEDYPVMPAYRVWFRLVPSGFFARNPALPR